MYVSDNIQDDKIDTNKYKTLTIKTETYIRLLRRKKYPEESFDKAVNRILDGETREQPR